MGRGASVAAEQARAFMEWLEATKRQSVLMRHDLQPFVHFCSKVAKHLEAHPERANDESILPVRRYCQDLDAYIDHASKGEPLKTEKTGEAFGFPAYEMSPQEQLKFAAGPSKAQSSAAPLPPGKRVDMALLPIPPPEAGVSRARRRLATSRVPLVRARLNG